jgi:clumping factor A
MRSTITLLIGLSTLLLFISIHSISYVNAQSALNNVSDNKSTDANSAVASENLDPFMLRGSSNDASTINNDQATDADGGSSTSSSSDDNNDASATDGGSSTSSSSDDNKDTSTSSSSDDNKDTSTSSSSDNDDDDNNGSDGDKSSKEDKNSDSKDDKKFELPFP